MRIDPLAVGLFLLTFAGLAHADPGTISLGSLLTSAVGAVASGVVGNMFSKKDQPAAAAPPPVTAPTAMPAKDEAAAEAKRRSIAAQLATRGRASTILTGDDSAAQSMG